MGRKTYDVHFIEEGSGMRDMVVLNADNKADLKKIMKRRFKGWKITKINLHQTF